MKLSSLIDYISFLLKKYGELQKNQMKNTFRVASIKKSAGDTKIIFQVIGKSTFMECSPSEILSNDAFIERFSHRDVQKITLAYVQEETLKNNQDPHPNLQLIRQEFNLNDGRTTFLLRDKEGNSTLKTASEISKDKKIIKDLTQQDALNIGYIAGYEHSQNDSNI